MQERSNYFVMPKAKRLPSGNYRVQVYDCTDANGKRHYKSFTAPTKKEAEFLAAQYLMNKKLNSKNELSKMTVGKAIDKYIESRSAVYSPTTKRTVISTKQYFKDIEGLTLEELDTPILQTWINKLSSQMAPKTVRNVWGLLTAVNNEYMPERRLKVALPPKAKSHIAIPTEKEIKRLLKAAEGLPVELPILFACCLGMRRSEIVAVTWDNIDLENGTILISEAVVKDINNEEVRKKPKSYAGTRTLVIPELLLKKLREVPEEDRTGSVAKMSGDAIYNSFQRLLKACKIRHYRFHDLRHYFASVMHSLGIPSKYAATRMGHADETMIMRVYQHIMETKMNESTKKLDEYFSSFELD